MTFMSPVECRCLLAGDPVVTLTSRGTLSITGTEAADVITVTKSGKSYVVHAVGGRGGLATDAAASIKSVKRITIKGRAGDDRITVGKGVDDRLLIDAGGGDDRVDTFNGNATTIDGGSGDDCLRHLYKIEERFGISEIDPVYVFTNAWSTLIRGGSGDDELSTSGGADTLDGGSGDGDRLVTLESDLIVATQLPDPDASPPIIRDTSEVLTVYTVGNETFGSHRNPLRD